MNDKKGVELSMNLIIIAAIALLVLVIIAVLVLRSTANVNIGTSCSSNSGGHCVASTTDCTAGETVFPGGGCPTSAAPKCCFTAPI